MVSAKSLILRLTLCSLYTLFAHNIYADEQTDLKETPPAWYIVGGVRNYNYALIEALTQNGSSCTVFTPEEQRKEAQAFYKDNPLVSLVFGCSSKERAKLISHAHGAKNLFFDVEFENFSHWKTSVETSLQNCIDAAEQHSLTFFYPGKIFPHGVPKEAITTQTPYAPISDQGRIMQNMEQALARAATQKKFRVHIIRTGRIYGENVRDYITKTIFTDTMTTGTFTWLFRTDIPYQFCYAPDVARLVLFVSMREHIKWFTVTHLAGHTYQSVESFGRKICECARTTYKPYVVGEWQFSLVCVASPNARRGKDVAYIFKKKVFLQDDETYTTYPEFSLTDPATSFQQTLEWHKNNQQILSWSSI